jgi:hypothetical protein
MAKDLGVTEKSLKTRLERAGVIITKEMMALKNADDTLGLL